MAIPKAKPEGAKKKKNLWDKVKGSAIFWLVVVIGFSVGIIYLVLQVSKLLSGK